MFEKFQNIVPDLNDFLIRSLIGHEFPLPSGDREGLLSGNQQ